MVHFNTEYINIVLFQFSIVNFNMPAQHGDFHVLPQHDVLDNMFFFFICQQDQQDLLLHAWVQHFVEQHLFWRVDVNMQVDNIDFICFLSSSRFHCQQVYNTVSTPTRSLRRPTMTFANPEIDSTRAGQRCFASQFGPTDLKHLAEIFKVNKVFGEDNWEEEINKGQQNGHCYTMVPYTAEDYNMNVGNMAVQSIDGNKMMPTWSHVMQQLRQQLLFTMQHNDGVPSVSTAYNDWQHEAVLHRCHQDWHHQLCRQHRTRSDQHLQQRRMFNIDPVP